jgi:hypothetical protein
MLSANWVKPNETLHFVEQEWIEFTFHIFKRGMTMVLRQVCKQGMTKNGITV